jgi:galactokinase
MAAQFKNLGYSIGGFDAVISSDVLPGSGLSSSASIEVLIGTILNHFYNEGKISKVQISQISQYAENVYFGKPCGLMDQLSCALGGVIQIDFKDLAKPKIKKMDVNFQSFGYDLIIVNTGGDHIDLTDEYASIPNDMKLVAKKFGKPSLRKVNEKIFFKNIPKLSLALGDRAVLRAYHYFIENKRIDSQVIALENSDFDLFLKLFNESGNSSFRWLQNVYTHKNVKKQPISLAIALTEEFFNDNSCKGGVRIHGGGFAGTILTIIPKEFSKYYIKYMEPIFGKGNIVELRITNIGTCIIL